MRPLNTTERLLSDFSNFLLLERGLSGNTLESYHTDVIHLLEFLEERELSLTDVDTDALHQFLCTLRDLGISPRSQARMLSGIRAFFRFLRLKATLTQTPANSLEAPRFGRTLPDILSVEDIDSMIAALDPGKRRNAAKPCDNRDSVRQRPAGVRTCGVAHVK